MSQKANRAAERGDLAALAALATAGEDLSAGHKLRTPLIEAAIAGHGDAVDWLIRHGVDPNATDTVMGWTALGWAASAGDAALVKRLLDAGTDVECQTDEYGRTPLLAAAQAGAADVVDLLLAAGANPAARNSSGATAADQARASGHADLAERLDALLPPELRADAPAPVRTALPWPDEPLALLRWPEDFPPPPAHADWRAIAMGDDQDWFNAGFHAALAQKLAPAFASPTAALQSWVQSMHHWELSAARVLNESAAQGPARTALMNQALAGAMALRHAFATPRVRKYPRASIGSRPELPLHLDMQAIETPTTSKCVITTQHRLMPADEPEATHLDLGARTRGEAGAIRWPVVECRFTLMRKAGQWRIDSWQQRYDGAKTWNSQIL